MKDARISSGRRATSAQCLFPQWGSSFPESAKRASLHLQGPEPQNCCRATRRAAEGLAAFVLHRYSSLWLSSVGKLLIKSKLDPLYMMAKFDGGTQFQVHALLNGGKGKEQQGLPVDFLSKHKIQIIYDVHMNGSLIMKAPINFGFVKNFSGLITKFYQG